MRVYRIAALAISAVLLIALVAMLLSTGEHTPTTTTTTTGADTRNDGVVSETERVDGSFSLDRVTLNRFARLVCNTTATSENRTAVRQAVLVRLQSIRPDVNASTAGALTDAVAVVSCLSAWSALP